MMPDYEGTDRVQQVNWLQQLASDTVGWTQSTLAEWLDQGGTRESYIEALVEDAISEEMPSWFDDLDRRLLHQFMAGEIRLTTADAAEELGVIPRRVRQLIEEGRLPAVKVGRDWLIEPRHLDLVRERKVGRPSKQD